MKHPINHGLNHQTLLPVCLLSQKNISILWMEEILHHPLDVWNPINTGVHYLSQLVSLISEPSTVSLLLPMDLDNFRDFFRRIGSRHGWKKPGQAPWRLETMPCGGGLGIGWLCDLAPKMTWMISRYMIHRKQLPQNHVGFQGIWYSWIHCYLLDGVRHSPKGSFSFPVSSIEFFFDIIFICTLKRI